jgi:hypothetical protein
MPKLDLSPLTKHLLSQDVMKPLQKGFVSVPLDSEAPPPSNTVAELSPLYKSILDFVDNSHKQEPVSLAFDLDPKTSTERSSIYRQKVKLLPDSMLKKIAREVDLVSTAIRTREHQASQFGVPQPDQDSNGYVIRLKKHILEELKHLPDEDERNKLKFKYQAKIANAVVKLSTCGSTEAVKESDKMTFSAYLAQSVRSALTVGRLATEIRYSRLYPSGEKVFHSFRPRDAGTIYRATKLQNAAEQLRQQAIKELERIQERKIDIDRFRNDEYEWIQAIDSNPVQAFTDDEMCVHNFYAVPDYELEGYPLTPIDTVVTAVMTQINICTHNKLYFQNGRAATGFITVTSDEVDEKTLQRFRQQMNASINNVNNSWRLPVFAIGTGSDIKWVPMDPRGRDQEFQYLMDMNARVILSAFQMSPDEITGMGYLARGTNSQALSESNNEFKLEAARDVGIRPLVAQLNEFLNHRILPLIDPELAEVAEIQLVGLDAETAEKRAIRIQEEAPLFMSYNDILDEVEKHPVPKFMGGEYPLNPSFQQVLDKNVTVGVQLEYFLGIKGASQDPRYNYLRDPMYFTNMQMQMAQQQQAQAAAQPTPPGGGGSSGPDAPEPPIDPAQDAEQAPGQMAQNQQKQVEAQAPQDLTRAFDQIIYTLSKGEKEMSPKVRTLVAQHRATVDEIMRGFEKDAKEATHEIVSSVKRHLPNKKR